MTVRRLPTFTPPSVASLLVLLMACSGPHTHGPPAPDAVDATNTITSDAQATPDPRRPTPLPPGLRATGRVHHPGSPRQGPHLSELVVYGDHVYVANATDLVTAFELEPDGGLRLTHDARAPDSARDYCQFLDAHAPSESLLCAQLIDDTAPLIRRLDLTIPDTPASASSPAEAGAHVPRDLAISGDLMVLAANDHGLLVATLDDSGAIGPLEPIAPPLPFATQVAASDSLLAALDTHRGLVTFDTTGATPAVLPDTPLSAPLTDLAVAGSAVAVGLGSLGARVFERLDSTLTETAHVTPPCVVSAVALRPDAHALAVACLSGLFLYDLRADPPRVAGFEPSLGTLLDVAWTDDGSLVATDWEWLTRWTVDLDGHSLRVDRPRGVHLPLQAPAHIPLTNPGDVRLTGTLAPAHDTSTSLATFDLEPGASATLTLSADVVADWSDAPWPAVFEILVEPADGVLPSHEHLQQVTVLPRAAPTFPEAAPAQGDTFPALTLSSPADEAVVTPAPGEATRLVFFSSDCSAMWTELIDLAWLAQHGPLPDSARPVLVTAQAPDVLHAISADLDLGPTLLLSTGGSHHHAAGEPGTPLGVWLYEEVFELPLIPGGAQHPTDYLIDADGLVQRVDRVYRGLHAL